ncbi:hypothetical protein D3C80_1312220 [compost metagenome]
MLPEQQQRFEELPLPRGALHVAGPQPVEADADALDESRLGMECLEQRQWREFPRQLEAIQRRLAGVALSRGRRQAEQAVHPLAEYRFLVVAILIGALQQALLGRSQAGGCERIVQLFGGRALLIELFEPGRVAQHLPGQHTHG